MFDQIKELFGVGRDARTHPMTPESELCFNCGGDMTKTLKHRLDNGNIICEYCWLKEAKNGMKRNKDFTLADQAVGRCPYCLASADMDCECEKRAKKEMNVKKIVEWLSKEEERLEARKKEAHASGWEVASLEGSSMTVRKLLDWIESREKKG